MIVLPVTKSQGSKIKVRIEYQMFIETPTCYMLTTSSYTVVHYNMSQLFSHVRDGVVDIELYNLCAPVTLQDQYQL